MGFLIEGYWYQADAYKDGINVHRTPTSTKDFAKAKKTEFPTKAEFDGLPQDQRRDRRLTSCSRSASTRSTRSCSSATRSRSRRPRSRPTTTPTSASSAPRRRATSTWSAPTARPRRRRRCNALKSGQSWDHGRQEVLGRRRGQDHGGLLPASPTVRRRPRSTRSIFASPAEQARRADQGHLRLVRARGHQDHPGDPASRWPRRRRRSSGCSPSQSRPTAEAKVNAAGQEELGQADHLPRRRTQVTDCPTTRRRRRRRPRRRRRRRRDDATGDRRRRPTTRARATTTSRVDRHRHDDHQRQLSSSTVSSGDAGDHRGARAPGRDHAPAAARVPVGP